jgi:ABC-2 type transport system ATP-binding protein
MRRRLDLAASLLGEPQILFLDEPTTGLDPSGRSRTWDIIRGLIDGGTTILLTTQYLDEADQLADRIVVVDGGRVIAEGTSDELKAMVGTNHVDVTISADSPFDDARRVLEVHAPGAVHVDASARLLSMPARSDEPGLVTTVVGALAESGVLVDALDVRRPSLDDVFLELTGHAAEQLPADDEEEAA